MYSVRLLNYSYVWGKRYVFKNFFNISTCIVCAY